MSEIRIKFLIIYSVAVVSAYLLKKHTYKIAFKAIQEEELSTGIYRYFPVKGKRAVELAKGHIRGVNIYFWFMVVIFPLGFLLAYLYDAI
jgi:hypothetical protein